MNYEIIDKFLSEEEFVYLKNNTILNYEFPLFLQNGVSKPNANDGGFFTHYFFKNGEPCGNHYNLIYPILKKINPSKIFRVQLNLYPKTFFTQKHNWHVDGNFQHKGCILYLNSNNGFTILKNNPFNVKIKSVENRVLFFDPHKKHRSTTCTNKLHRSIIIINYI